jgi:hypothetical protein
VQSVIVALPAIIDGIHPVGMIIRTASASNIMERSQV